MSEYDVNIQRFEVADTPEEAVDIGNKFGKCSVGNKRR